MKHIALFGAGKSSHALINYLVENAVQNDWSISIGDLDTSHLERRLKANPQIQFFKFDIQDINTLIPHVEKADIAISMVPAMYHLSLAKLCLQYKKHLITPSYISDEMQSLHEEAKVNGLIFLNEMGLDPGIDHMSAMRIIHQIQSRQAIVTSFKSYCGGMIAPASDNNPWNYKFTWNPRNVVLAGQGKGGIKYLSKGKYKYIPYYNLFKHSKSIAVGNYGDFDAYPNRDSLKYRSVYGLNDIQTMLRGTLRRSGFCRAWDIFVQLGMTDDTYALDIDENTSCADFMNCFIDSDKHADIKLNLADQMQIDEHDPLLDKFTWLGMFSKDIAIGKTGSPAQILQAILERKLKLEDADKDWVLMYHEFEFLERGERKKIESCLSIEGKDSYDTAMALTVGLPIGIACKLISYGKIQERGVLLPIHREFYEPILDELKHVGIEFEETESII